METEEISDEIIRILASVAPSETEDSQMLDRARRAHALSKRQNLRTRAVHASLSGPTRRLGRRMNAE